MSTINPMRRLLFACQGRQWISTSAFVENEARVSAAKSYLEAWVGGGADSPSKNAVSVANNAVAVTSKTSPLLLSGSSYVMATLRLEKIDTPDSIAERLHEEVDPNILNTRTNSAEDRQWKCPIVLDLRAWSPDGSPHYRPPQQGTLTRMVEVLGRYGMAVVGLNGTPKELEREAIEDLGLPSLRIKQAERQNLQITLGEVVHMVKRRQHEESMLQENSKTSEPTTTGSSLVQSEPTFESSSLHSPERLENEQNEEVAPSQIKDTTDSPDQALQPQPIASTATIYKGSVRSGQQVSAEKGQSLLVFGSVSSGGEVLSDGDITVFGKLRGRALAGLASPNAHIIASSMDPEMICVGDVLSTVDRMEEFGIQSGDPAMVSLNESKELVFENIVM